MNLQRIIILLVACGVALPAMARGAEDDHRNESRAERRDAPADDWSFRQDGPSVQEMGQVRSLARDLERAAQDLERQIDQLRGKRAQRDQIEELVEDLLREAQNFRERVDRYERSPQRTVDDFIDLYRTFRRLDAYVADRRFNNNPLLQRVESIVSALAILYDIRTRPVIDWRRVLSDAGKVDDLASRVYAQATAELSQHGRRGYDGRSKDTLDVLAELRQAAAQFERAIDPKSYERDPKRARPEFERLQNAQQRAAGRVWNLTYQTRNQFYQLSGFVRELDQLLYDPNRGYGASSSGRASTPGSTVWGPSNSTRPDDHDSNRQGDRR